MIGKSAKGMSMKNGEENSSFGNLDLEFFMDP